MPLPRKCIERRSQLALVVLDDDAVSMTNDAKAGRAMRALDEFRREIAAAAREQIDLLEVEREVQSLLHGTSGAWAPPRRASRPRPCAAHNLGRLGRLPLR